MVWAGINTGMAIAAAVRYGGIVLVGRVGGYQFPNVAIGPEGWIYEECVASYPAKACPSSPLLVADGDGVDTGLCFKVWVSIPYGGN